MKKLFIAIIPLLMLGNTVTIKSIYDESESDKFLSCYHRPAGSWHADSFHNSNAPKQTPNYELASEMKKSKLGCWHFRMDLTCAEGFASPGFAGVRTACDDFVTDLGFDSDSIYHHGILNTYCTMLSFAESLGVDVNISDGLTNNFYSRSPFSDTVCSFYSVEYDSTFYYYQHEVDIIKDFMKSFHYFFGDPDADGVEGMWASLRADSCADCSSDPNVPFCGHNHPEPFDGAKYISVGNQYKLTPYDKLIQEGLTIE